MTADLFLSTGLPPPVTPLSKQCISWSTRAGSCMSCRQVGSRGAVLLPVLLLGWHQGPGVMNSFVP